MQYESLKAFLSVKPHFKKGPAAILFCEDEVDQKETIDYHIARGFPNVIVFNAAPEVLFDSHYESLHFINHEVNGSQEASLVLNQLFPKFEGEWVYFGFNTEYLYYPFSEQRQIQEFIEFVVSERRESVFGTVVDLYTNDLKTYPTGVSHDATWLDASSYFGEPYWCEETKTLHDREIVIRGGLLWRFSEHLKLKRICSSRIPLFLVKPGLTLDTNLRFNDPEYNTISCPWHHNATVAIASFRVAKALISNPSTRKIVKNFHWQSSAPFNWSSVQLMQYGFMEPGQWF